MVMIKAKGNEFNLPNVKDSFNRRVQQFRERIIANLSKIDLLEGYVDVSEEIYGLKKAQASALWFIDGHRLYYSYNLCNTFVENLYVVSKVIELEVNKLLNKQKTMEEFIGEFTENKDVEEKRKEARKILGVNEDSKDMDEIDRKYKDLAKEYHPDMPNGSTEQFKIINNAHKTLKRELQ